MSAARSDGAGAARYDVLPAGARGVWRLETEHGTVVFFDFDEGLFHRIPAVHGDGTLSTSPWDHRWTRCGLGPNGPTSEEPVRVGHRAMYGIGFCDYVTTSTVVEIRRATEPETPPPNTPQWQADSWRSPRVAAWCSWDLPDITGEGGNTTEALADLAQGIDTWLDHVALSSQPGRTAKGWLARRDQNASVLAWVLQHAQERSPRW